MVTTYEIYLREKNVAENCQADSNQRKCQTHVCENLQSFNVRLRDTKKEKNHKCTLMIVVNNQYIV